MKKYDLIPASVAIVVALVFLFIFKLNMSAGQKVKVFVNNSLFAEYSLDENREAIIPSFDENGYLVMNIHNGRVSVISSECKNQVCVNTGIISEKGQSIVCLPQKIVIQISDEKKSEFDGITN